MDDTASGPVVVALVADLFLAVPIADAIRGAGACPELLESAADLAESIEGWPALVLIDLSVGGDWQSVIRRSKLLPQSRSIPVVAFGSHVDTEALRAARAAGCDHAWARSRFVKELPHLLQEIVHPPVRQVADCHEPAPPLLLKGVAQFNAGDYWECHETLEGLWMAEPGPVRDLYQGILQIGVAFHHLQQRNFAGAVKMLRRGLPRLRGLPAVCHGVPVADLAQAARRVHDQVIALGPERITEFDLSTLPHIEFASLLPQ